MDILVLFGSSSDEPVYSKITSKIECEIKICSAHRNPELLNEILKSTKAKVIIAGAGLAAHLPGVIASKSIRPVIGVPVSSNFEGLDSLLSIAQMPPNIPVLTVGVNNSSQAADFAQKILKGFRGVNIIYTPDKVNQEKYSKIIQKTKDSLKQFGVIPEMGPEKKEMINIRYIELGKKIPDTDNFLINVPVLENSKLSDAEKLLKATNSGLWVGLNRGENAAIAAIEILSINGKYDKKLREYRKKLKTK